MSNEAKLRGAQDVVINMDELNYGVSKELAGKGLSTARKNPERDKHCA